MAAPTRHVVAHFTARAGQESALVAAARTLIAPTRAEAGCIRYDLMQNPAEPRDITFIEEWTTDAALDAHLATPHVAAALALATPLVAAPPDIRRYTQVG